MSTRHWAYPGGVGGRKASVALPEFSPDYPDPLPQCLRSDDRGVGHPRHRHQPPALVGRLRSIAATPIQRYPSEARLRPVRSAELDRGGGALGGRPLGNGASLNKTAAQFCPKSDFRAAAKRRHRILDSSIGSPHIPSSGPAPNLTCAQRIL